MKYVDVMHSDSETWWWRSGDIPINVDRKEVVDAVGIEPTTSVPTESGAAL